MFISTNRFNPFQQFNRTFDSFLDEDLFNQLAFLSNSQNLRFSKEDKLKQQLNKLHNEENDIAHYIKQYELQLQELKKSKENIQKQKTELTDKISKIAEENKKKTENATQDSKESKTNESYVFKRVHYKTDGMEVEEQYDSSNPKNCFKIIRKQGEAPQIIEGEKATQTIQNQNEKQQTEQKIHTEETGLNNVDGKYEQLSRMLGKQSVELKTLVDENKDLTIGQLFDKATSQNLL